MVVKFAIFRYSGQNSRSFDIGGILMFVAKCQIENSESDTHELFIHVVAGL